MQEKYSEAGSGTQAPAAVPLQALAITQIIAPHNLDLEQALLGALMFDSAWAEELPETLGVESFFDPCHGRLFAEIIRRAKLKLGADPSSLLEFWRADPASEALGVSFLLDVYAKAAPIKRYALEHAWAIVDMATRRKIQDAARSMLTLAGTPGDLSAAEILADAETKIREIEAPQEGAGIIGLQEVGKSILAGLDDDRHIGLRTGLSKLDRLIGGLHKPDFIVLAARPGIGKTAYALNIATNVACDSVVTEDGEFIRDRVVLFVSLEMDREQLASRILSRWSYSLFKRAFQYRDFRSFDQGSRPDPMLVADLVRKLPKGLVIDDRGNQTVASISATARRTIRKYGALDLIVIDYLQLLHDPSIKADNRLQEISRITADLKSALAKRFQVPVLALAQLSRAVEQRADKIPQLADLRESGTIEQDADIVMFLYREHYYRSRQEPKPQEGENAGELKNRVMSWEAACTAVFHDADVILGKNRHGPTGTAKLWCDLAYDIFSDDIVTRNQG